MLHVPTHRGNCSTLPPVTIPASPVNNRFDAIGAIGIARCFTFGGAFKRVLHDPSVPPRANLTASLVAPLYAPCSLLHNFKMPSLLLPLHRLFSQQAR
jgi:hypothetical protein